MNFETKQSPIQRDIVRETSITDSYFTAYEFGVIAWSEFKNDISATTPVCPYPMGSVEHCGWHRARAFVEKYDVVIKKECDNKESDNWDSDKSLY